MFIAKRKIKGKTYFFLEKSLRLPNGKTIKISKILKSKPKNLSQIVKKHKNYFIKKEKKAFTDFALKNYQFKYPLSKEDIQTIENIKIEYKYIVKKLKKENIKDLFDRFTVNFTYESNAIEGNSLTLKDVAIVISENKTVEGKDIREIYETKNSRQAVNLLLRKKIKISHKGIIQVHKIIMQNIEKESGYKKLPNIILGSNLKTSPPEKVYQHMTELINWYDQNRQKIHPLQLAVIFHGWFEKIHPFKDGNGRVGRFLLNAILVNDSYPPLIIRKTQRVKYLHALHAFDQKTDIPLIRFILEKYKSTYRNFYQIYFKYV
ncbi:Fic family protein [Candidatus Woesearchaeota archaeon]|nr:Fic family protein [Candidatus Woesearchaeota archaeon]